MQLWIAQAIWQKYHLLFSRIFLYLNLLSYIKDFDTRTFKEAVFTNLVFYP